MPDLSDADRAQAVEAARQAGAIPARAAALARLADLSRVPRTVEGILDPAALTAAMGAAAYEAPELTLHHPVEAPGGPRRAPATGGAPQGASPTTGPSDEAKVAEYLAIMQGFAGVHPREAGR